MRLNHRMIALMLSATALVSAAAMTGCASSGLYYDSQGHDYHRWNRGEDRYYLQWETQTRRGHVPFQRRTAADRQAYWGWRRR
jgi:hypothetical protein